MTKLRPPDGRVFVTIDKKHKKQYDATVQAIGRGSEFTVGQKICIVGHIEKVEIQDLDIYSVFEANVVMTYE